MPDGGGPRWEAGEGDRIRAEDLYLQQGEEATGVALHPKIASLNLDSDDASPDVKYLLNLSSTLLVYIELLVSRNEATDIAKIVEESQAKLREKDDRIREKDNEIKVLRRDNAILHSILQHKGQLT